MFTAFSFALENHWGWDPLSKFSGASTRYDNTKNSISFSVTPRLEIVWRIRIKIRIEMYPASTCNNAADKFLSVHPLPKYCFQNLESCLNLYV